MSDLYDADIVAWSERQAAPLRRIAEGERIKSNEIDWPNKLPGARHALARARAED